MSSSTTETATIQYTEPDQIIAKARRMRAEYMHRGARYLVGRVVTAFAAIDLHVFRAGHFVGSPETGGK